MLYSHQPGWWKEGYTIPHDTCARNAHARARACRRRDHHPRSLPLGCDHHRTASRAQFCLPSSPWWVWVARHEWKRASRPRAGACSAAPMPAGMGREDSIGAGEAPNNAGFAAWAWQGPAPAAAQASSASSSAAEDLCMTRRLIGAKWRRNWEETRCSGLMKPGHAMHEMHFPSIWTEKQLLHQLPLPPNMPGRPLLCTTERDRLDESSPQAVLSLSQGTKALSVSYRHCTPR